MKVTRKCRIDGNEYTMNIPKLTPLLLARIETRGDVAIQVVAPQLSPAEREFFITGIPPRVWKKMFGDM